MGGRDAAGAAGAGMCLANIERAAVGPPASRSPAVGCTEPSPRRGKARTATTHQAVELTLHQAAVLLEVVDEGVPDGLLAEHLGRQGRMGKAASC